MVVNETFLDFLYHLEMEEKGNPNAAQAVETGSVLKKSRKGAKQRILQLLVH
jgi:hypothetical protein